MGPLLTQGVDPGSFSHRSGCCPGRVLLIRTCVRDHVANLALKRWQAMSIFRCLLGSDGTETEPAPRGDAANPDASELPSRPAKPPRRAVARLCSCTPPSHAGRRRGRVPAQLAITSVSGSTSNADARPDTDHEPEQAYSRGARLGLPHRVACPVQVGIFHTYTPKPP
jgi:hypothetical protein